MFIHGYNKIKDEKYSERSSVFTVCNSRKQSTGGCICIVCLILTNDLWLRVAAFDFFNIEM